MDMSGKATTVSLKDRAVAEEIEATLLLTTDSDSLLFAALRDAQRALAEGKHGLALYVVELLDPRPQGFKRR